MKSSWRVASVCLVKGGAAAALLSSSLALAVPPDNVPPPVAKAALAAEAEPATAEDIAGWIRDLDADKFELRQRATDQLGKAGADVIDPLIDAAGKGSLEVAMRTVTILKELFQSPDSKTRVAAKAALEKLATSENKAIASRAESVLKPETPAVQPANRPGMFFPPIPGNLGGRIQIQGGGGNIQVIQIQAGINGGNINRNIQVRENGRSIKITEDNNGIKISVTEPVNGKDETKSYEAKDVAELKQKHPEAHKLYEKHAAKAGANIIVNGAFPALPALPLPRAIAPPGGNPADAQRQLDEVRKQLEDAVKQLRASGDNEPGKDSIREALEKLDAAQRALGEAEKKLKD